MAFRHRLRLLLLLAGLGTAVVWVRMLELQIVEGDVLGAEARAMRLWVRDLPAPRGRIRDRAGRVVARDLPVAQLSLVGAEWTRRARLRCTACGTLHFYDPSSTRRARRTRPRACACRDPSSELREVGAGELGPLEEAVGLPPGRLATLAQQRIARVEELVAGLRERLEGGDGPDFLVDDAVEQRRDDLLHRRYVLVSRIPPEAVRCVEMDEEGRYRGFRVTYALRREYDPEGPPGQMLGFVSVVRDEEELESLRRRFEGHVTLDTRIGRDGLERAYEDLLLGKKGEERLARAPDGSFSEVVDAFPPQGGKELRLTLTSEACRKAEELMAGAGRGEGGYAPQALPSGGFLLMEAATGAILAWGELPRLDLSEGFDQLGHPADVGAAFDPAIGQWMPAPGKGLREGETLEEWRARLSKPAPRTLSRNARIAVEPGSTMKAFIGLGLLEGLAQLPPGTPLPLHTAWPRFDCASLHMKPGCHHHEAVDFVEALAVSCNRYFARSLRDFPLYWQTYRRSVPALLVRLGFGRPTGVDVFGEGSGVLLKDYVDFDPAEPVEAAVAAVRSAGGVRVTLGKEPSFPTRIAGRDPARLEGALAAAVSQAAAALGADEALVRVGSRPGPERLRDLHLLLAFRPHPDGPSPRPAAEAEARHAVALAFRPLGAAFVEPPVLPGATAFELRLRYHEPTGRLPGEGLVILPDDGRNVAIGQGPIATTPLQMVRAVAALANGGRLVTPHVVGWADGVALPYFTEDLRLDPDAVAQVRAGMRAVVEEPLGTAFRAGFDDVPARIYGKTGTSQPGPWWTPAGREDEGPWHHWFVGFAERPGQPTLAFACVLHARREGAAAGTAAPVVADFLRWWYRVGPGAE